MAVRTAAILFIFVIIFTGLLSGAYQWTKPAIEASAAEEKMKLVDEVLPRSEYDNNLLTDTITLPATAELGLAGDLFLGRVALSERHSNELPDHSLLNTKPVQPRLPGDHDIILWGRLKLIRPTITGHGIDFPGSDLDRERVARFSIGDVFGIKVDPHRLGLVHRQHHSTMLKPVTGHRAHVIIHMLERETSQPGGQGIIGPVVWNS
jgi:hypothetical protein